MQIIGTRNNSAFRVDIDYFSNKPQFTPGVDPTTGGPVLIVEDYTDTAATAPVGKQWRLDTDPNSPTYRQAKLFDVQLPGQ